MQWKSARRAAYLASACLSVGIVACPSAVAAQSETAFDFDLPAQDLPDTLRAIARMSRREVLFQSDSVRGLKAPAIKGRLSFGDALRAALSGTTLTIEFRAGAALIGEKATDHGELPSRTGLINSITVTGTRIRGVGSASPVLVTTRGELEEAGINSLADFTRILPQNYTGGQNPGIAGDGEQGGQSNLNNSATLNLRGLGSDATLTLLNGHRLSYDGVDQGVDISAIPLSAIDRIEVVSDGASALYGSDAVAGVANVILRRDYEGLETMARVGAATDGGDVQQEYSLVGGHRWSSGGFMIAIDRSLATPIYAGQRDYTRSIDPSLTLLDGNRQLSGVLTGHQQIAPGLSLDLDGYATNRRSLLQSPYTATADVHVNGLISQVHLRSVALTPTLHADLGSWQAALSTTLSDSRTFLNSYTYSRSVPRHVNVLYEDKLKGAEATAEGPLFALPGGDARLAFGGGLRSIALHGNSTTLIGAQHFTTKDFTQTRNVQFVYGELSLPLVRPDLDLPLVNRLTLSAALRYEHWNRIASETTPKLGLIYLPNSDVTVRATWGKSFKIPTLYQSNEIEEADLIPGYIFTPQPQPAGAPILLLGGSAPNLKPERATTWSGTVEFKPRILPGLDVQASYFHVDYRDRIAEPLTSVLTVLFNPLYNNFVVYNPTAAQVNAAIASAPAGLVNETGEPFDPSGVGAIIDGSTRNTERQRIHGVDFNVDYHIDLGTNGKLLLTGAASYLDSKQQLAPNQPILPLAGTIFNPPHWHGRGGIVWDRKLIGLSAFVNYLGPTVDNTFPTFRTIGSFVTADVTASLKTNADAGVFRNVDVHISVLNVLNEKPHPTRSAYPEAPPYDSTNESPVGRFVGAAIRKEW